GNFEYPTAVNGIYGQQAVEEVIAVATINVDEPGLDTVADYSSVGPAHLLFPAPVVRPKPDLTAFDGVMTSVPDFEVFFGTSAAAPHSAAVAALMLSKNPDLTPGQIQDTMKQTAIDIMTPGFDNLSGAGRLDAAAAVAAVPCTADAQCDDANLCTTDTCAAGTCVRAALTAALAASSLPPSLTGGACEKLPRKIRTRYRMATKLLRKVGDASEGRARRLAGKAQHLLDKAAAAADA